MPKPDKTIITRVVEGELPVDILYEDDISMAYVEVERHAPIHFLVVPKKPIESLKKMEDEDEAILGHLLRVAAQVADELGAEGAFRVVVNSGRDNGDFLYHVHLHVLGGRLMNWPPG